MIELTMSISFSYLIGKQNLWNLNLRWNYGSGFPFTQTKAYYENLNFLKQIVKILILQMVI